MVIKSFKSQETFFKAVQKEKITKITYEDLDVLFLRVYPPDEIDERNWVRNDALIFGSIARYDRALKRGNYFLELT